MNCGSKALFSVVAVVMLLLGSIAGWAALPVKDGDPGTIGECLTKPDSTTVTLPGVQVVSCGISGKSFKIKEFFEKPSKYPRLVVISASRLPVHEFWNVTVTGNLHTVTAAYGQQRALIVSPENVWAPCDSKGRPAPFLPVKDDNHYGLTRRSLADLAAKSVGVESVVRALSASSDAAIPQSACPRQSVEYLPKPIAEERMCMRYVLTVIVSGLIIGGAMLAGCDQAGSGTQAHGLLVSAGFANASDVSFVVLQPSDVFKVTDTATISQLYNAVNQPDRDFVSKMARTPAAF